VLFCSIEIGEEAQNHFPIADLVGIIRRKCLKEALLWIPHSLREAYP
jgi:hypothetical protein